MARANITVSDFLAACLAYLRDRFMRAPTANCSSVNNRRATGGAELQKFEVAPATTHRAVLLDPFGIISAKPVGGIANLPEVPEEDEDDDGWDFWLHEANLSCVGYDSRIDYDALAVLRGIADDKGSSQISKEMQVPEQYVELLQSIFCSVGWAGYGTSPGACWIDHDRDPKELIAKLERYVRRQWENPGPDTVRYSSA